jgi:hypothetical protein
MEGHVQHLDVWSAFRSKHEDTIVLPRRPAYLLCLAFWFRSDAIYQMLMINELGRLSREGLSKAIQPAEPEVAKANIFVDLLPLYLKDNDANTCTLRKSYKLLAECNILHRFFADEKKKCTCHLICCFSNIYIYL